MDLIRDLLLTGRSKRHAGQEKSSGCASAKERATHPEELAHGLPALQILAGPHGYNANTGSLARTCGPQPDPGAQVLFLISTLSADAWWD